jgi:F-type H+-transporting ATPase subunit gamma
MELVYNEYKSKIAFTTTRFKIPNMIKQVADSKEGDDIMPAALKEYDIEPEFKQEALKSLYEYGLASTLLAASLENATSEQSSRMSAMENATKNAGEMIDKLSLKYNRARQASITTELIEIISGAAALEKQKN